MSSRLTGGLRPLAIALVALVAFLFAVKLLGAATVAATPTLRRILSRLVVADPAALGAGWLAAYALGNGSVIAALGLSLFEAGLLSASELFLVVAGSRLGAAAIVVFVGALDYLQEERYSIAESVRMGSLTFLLTLSVYLPVTVLGYAVLPAIHPVLRAAGRRGFRSARAPRLFGDLPTAVTDAVGPGPAVLLAVGVMFGSLLLFDRVLDGVDTRALRRQFFEHFRRTWLSFAVGLVITGATTSVAFSLGVIVPLYNRGYVEREELVPYVLGANVGTLLDTLLVAVVLGSLDGFVVVLVLLAVGGAVTAAALVDHDRYCRAAIRADDLLLGDRRAFVAFAAVLLALPLALVLLPLVLLGG